MIRLERDYYRKVTLHLRSKTDEICRDAESMVTQIKAATDTSKTTIKSVKFRDHITSCKYHSIIDSKQTNE